MTRGHANPRRNEEEPLYDPDVPTPTHAERARTLLATLETRALAAVASEGHPYPSFVTFALEDGEPVFLLSEMAEHTQNIREVYLDDRHRPLRLRDVGGHRERAAAGAAGD